MDMGENITCERGPQTSRILSAQVLMEPESFTLSDNQMCLVTKRCLMNMMGPILKLAEKTKH